MLPSLLLLSTTILSTLLCTVVSHERAETGLAGQHALRHRRSLGHLDVVPLGPSTLLKPRVTFPPYINPEWILDYHDFTCMLPIGTAAAVMQDFYEDLAAYAATTLTPVSCGYQIWLGQLMLEIVAPPNSIVHWNLVQEFALDMLKMTKRGYTNTYQINFVHRPTGRLVTFSLYTGLRRGVTGGGS